MPRHIFTRHIFTYGSLMFLRVWQSVVRGSYRSEEAIVSGYARYAIAGETYPAMIAQADATVFGIVYFDVDDADIAALDVFEGADYRRDRVLAKRGAPDAESVQCEAYIYRDAAGIMNEPWNPETFQLDHFLNDYC